VRLYATLSPAAQVPDAPGRRVPSEPLEIPFPGPSLSSHNFGLILRGNSRDTHLLNRQGRGGYETKRPPNGGLRSCGRTQNYHVTHLPPRQ
jgi:hypothetical protein